MTERQILVAANWKMNGTLETIRPLLEPVIQGVQGISTEVAICPPAIYIPELAQKLDSSDIRLGAQNVSHLEKGAYTGEISVSMLKDYNCQYVIVGHSERRSLYGESDELVAEKFIAVQSVGMTPILCVGELLEEREANNTEEVIARQIDAVINLAGIAAFKKAVIAYEPVWAIGTGKTATPEQAEEVHEFIRLRLARHDNQTADIVRILYGGSVNAGNAEQLFKMANIDGGLIGGASLVAEDFLTICKA
jgi:triosephosphate isomerase (TIM)